MENEKNLKQIERETRDFLESLSLSEISRLLNTPEFSGELLEYAVQSPLLQQRIDQILDAEYREMSRPEQEEIDRLAERLTERFGLRSQAGKVLELRRKDKRPFVEPTDKPVLSLAASTGKPKGRKPETAATPFGSFTVGESTFQVAEDSEGKVFLLGPVPEGATHLYLGAETYELKPTKQIEQFEVGDVGMFEVAAFLRQHQCSPTDNPIGFKQTS